MNPILTAVVVPSLVDRALHYQLIETASGHRLGARYVPGVGTPESARKARVTEVIGESNG